MNPSSMSPAVRMKKTHVIGISIIILLLLYLLSSSIRIGWRTSAESHDMVNFPDSNVRQRRGHYSTWPAYSSSIYQYDWFKKKCWLKDKQTISTLSQVIARWAKASSPQCRKVYKKFMAIFDVTTKKTNVLIKGAFIQKVKHWLGDSDTLLAEANHQTVIKVYNIYTHENVLINPLRDKRPITKPEKPEREFIEELSEKAKPCDFCNFKENTAQDDFERIESRHSVSASNTFKWDKWHGLILTKQHHPLNWNQEQFQDLMDTAVKWFHTVQAKDPLYLYPVIIWDLLPHASASQVHPHIHTNLNSGRYYGYLENWRSAGEMYYQDTHSNYFTDLVGVHQALGLATQLGGATAFAHLIPRKDDEVVVVSPFADKDFFDLIFYTLRAYIDDMQKFCFSLVIALPPLGGVQSGQMPALARIVTRGPVSSIRSDISSVDLFVASNVNIDPYKVIGYVRKSVEKRQKSTAVDSSKQKGR